MMLNPLHHISASVQGEFDRTGTPWGPGLTKIPEGYEMEAILNRFWNDELGSTFVDWAIFGAGAASLGVAVVSTVF